MNIAVVGGGKRCKDFMDVIQRHTFLEVHPKIVAVADIRPDAPGLVAAMEKGLFITSSYDDFFDRDDIDLIVELTGSMDIYNDILAKKKKNVRAIADRTAQLFWEISRVSTMQKKTNQELQEARALYNMALNDLIQEEVLVIDHRFRIIDTNDAFLEKFGLTRDQVIGQFCHKITHHLENPCSGENHPCPLIQTLETEEPSQTTHIHLDKDNRKIYYSISTYPLIEEGDVIGAVEISRDITKDINVQKMMMQQEKLASVGRLSAGVAHEINNPLTTILTTAMLIQEDLDPEDPTYKELSIIASEALRCRKIVTNLLNFARQAQPDKKIHNINDIIGSCISLTQKQAAFKDISVTHDLADNLPPALVDKGQIEQAMINLIINAVEATPAGGKIHITTRPADWKEFIEVSVADTGEGIDESRLNQIFDPFYTTKENGTGLGLAITHGVIEQHGGVITVQSEPGKGTNFVITIPTEKKAGHEQ
ncbi:MAG: PAS domain-containing protein [Deltaproteobacteria bacterium]|nr:PAS domain-containing protein [Deltaproteobacteria bacterium]